MRFDYLGNEDFRVIGEGEVSRYGRNSGSVGGMEGSKDELPGRGEGR